MSFSLVAPQLVRSRPASTALALTLGLCVLPGCGRETLTPPPETPAADRPAAPVTEPVAQVFTLSVMATNDVHGRVGRLAVIGGYVENLRRVRAADGGAVVLLDAGDIFQGTLESNMTEGAPMVAAFNALEYDAAALGNHEFDYGPVGPDATPQGPSDDPRGALLARVAEMRFPLLVANLQYRDGRRLDWPGVLPSVLLDPARTRGVPVGVIGGTTAEALTATLAANVLDLAVTPLVPAVREQARALRAQGAAVVLLTVHAGGQCSAFEDPHDLRSCDAGQEIFEFARELGPGVVDLVVAGHSHAGVAHIVSGVPIIESYANGAAFGRVDLTVDAQQRRVTDVRMHPPHFTCDNRHGELGACETSPYEGAAVVPHAGVIAATRDALASAEALRARPLGVSLPVPLERRHQDEGPLGNLLADLMRALYPDADVAVLNAGGVRHAIAAGPLTYGKLYEAIPFDNLFARVRLTARDIREMYEENLSEDNGLLLISGLRVRARCDGGRVAVRLEDSRGRAVPDRRVLVMITNEFLATGERHGFGRLRAAGDVTIEPGPPMRDHIAQLLERRGGVIDGRDPTLFDPTRLRVDYPGRRPMVCPPSAGREAGSRQRHTQLGAQLEEQRLHDLGAARGFTSAGFGAHSLRERQELREEVVNGVAPIVQRAVLRPRVVRVEVVGPHARARGDGAEHPDDAQRFEPVSVLKHLAQRRCRGLPTAKAVCADGLPHAARSFVIEAQLEQPHARHGLAALAGERPVRVVLRHVDHVVQQCGSDDLA